jgi:hypothetical protein
MMLGSDAGRTDIAGSLGIPQDQLNISETELTLASVPASLPRAALTAAGPGAESFVLIAHTDDTLPVIGLEASAPSRAAAVDLVNGAVHYLQSRVSPQSDGNVQGLTVTPVGPVEAKTLPGGSGRKKMAIVFVGLFGMWASALLAGPLLRGIAASVRASRPVPS